MWGMFGGKKKKKEAPIDPTVTMQNLNGQIDNLEKRQKLLESRIGSFTKQAIAEKKKGNTRSAVMALKKKKMNEQEMNKIDGMRMLLEQQKISIESASMDSDVFGALQTSNKALQGIQDKLNIEKFEELKDEMEEQTELRNEIQEFFGNVAAEDEDDLLAELDDLVGEEEGEELDEMEGMTAPTGAVKQPAAAVHAAPAKQETDEKDLLADLMA